MEVLFTVLSPLDTARRIDGTYGQRRYAAIRESARRGQCSRSNANARSRAELP